MTVAVRSPSSEVPVVRSRPAATRRRLRSRLTRPVLGQIALILGGLTIVGPLLYVISVALRSPGDYFAQPYGLIPQHPTIVNFRSFFAVTDVGRLMLNSVIICAVASVGTVVSSAVVAYPLARLRFRGSTLLTVLVLSTMMLPPQVLLIPQYILFVKLHWVDTFLPLTIPAWFATNGFLVFFLRQSFRGNPTRDGGSSPG